MDVGDQLRLFVGLPATGAAPDPAPDGTPAQADAVFADPAIRDGYVEVVVRPSMAPDVVVRIPLGFPRRNQRVEIPGFPPMSIRLTFPGEFAEPGVQHTR